MNKYFFGILRITNGLVKTCFLKVAHRNKCHIVLPAYISPYTELTMDADSRMSIGNGLKMRSASKIRVRKGAQLIIGNKFNMSGHNWITVRDRVEIGNNVTLGPGTLIYDHDHDYITENGIRDGKYLTSPVVIGDNVWIGANCILLRGTEIGNNCVIGAGTVLKGKYDDNSLIYQKRDTFISERKYKQNK